MPHLLATVDGRGANMEAVTKTILQNAEVLASGQKTAQQDNNTSWFVGFGGHRSGDTNMQDAPTGMIRRSSVS